MKIIWMLLGCLVVSVSSWSIAYGSGLNEYETRIIEEAGAIYEYEGELYKVEPIYIALLREYLSKGGVDLTEKDMEQVLEKAYASLATGVAGGYLVPWNEDIQEEETTDIISAIEQGKITKDSILGLVDGILDSTDNTEQTPAIEAPTVEVPKEEVEYTTILKDTGFNMGKILYCVIAMVLLLCIGIYVIYRYRLYYYGEDSDGE